MKLNKRLRKVFSMFLAFLMFCSVVCTDLTLIAPKTEAEASTATDYGLLDNACDGLILHCWNWSYTNIKNSMADIAAAGYTSVQTSPVQMPKDAGSDTQMNWWKVYQPTTLSMVDNHPWFGSKDEFKAMCDEAEKYGIKVIVDIVANHMANNTGSKGNCKDDICSQNDATFRDDESCWHLNGSTYIDYGNQHRNGDTTSLTWGFGGWPDLNTGSTKVQNAIISLLKECVDLGADGFRFDAAKHIELPTDPGGASDFWPNVTNAIRAYKSDVYLYGEILDDSATSISNYTKYIAVTDNRAGNATRYGVRDNNIGKAANSSLTYDGELGDNIVLWAESHDTYANDNFTGESSSFTQAQINRAWCIVAARDFAALYYVRPGSTSAAMGTKSTNTAWQDSEIVAVNKFHNYFSGKSEYMSSYDNSVVLVERGSKTADGGVVLVNIGGGSKSVSGATTHLLADGEYTDQVTGNKFTVSGGTISGQIGSTGVAVVYNPGPIVTTPTPTISKEGGNFTDTLTLTLGLKNATSGTYKIGSGSATTYTSSKSITIGSDMAVGDSVTITLTATDGTDTTTKSYTFKKVEKSQNIVYFQNSNGWSTVNAHMWSDSEIFTTWPGTAMTNEGNGVYSVEVPDGATSIIFNDGTNQTDDLTIQMGKIYKGGSWQNYDPDYEFTPPYENGIYFENTEGWASVCAYYWSDSNTGMTTWPGVQMKEIESGIYGLELDEDCSAGYVIFNNNNNGSQTDDLTFTMNGYYNTSGLVEVLDPTTKGTVTVKYVDESGNQIATAKTLTGNVGDSYTTSAVTVDGYTLKTTPNNATGTYTSADITVTYVYSEIVDTDPVVTSSLASGSTFKTETQTITLTLKNAVSGTYSVDDGPTKSFTSTESVVLGQGKVADSTVTVKATATSADGTVKSFTFTYNKQFNGTVDEENNTVSTYSTSTSAVSTTSTTSSQGLASQYSTNKAGVGVKKTISVDGSLSDWDSSMLIAQGAANDDPRVYRPNSMYELPIDLYALYGAYDDNNLYLMWEMTNVQDVVAPNDDYPLSQGVLWQTQELPFFIAVDTGDSSTAIGNNAQLTTGGTIWESGMTISSSFNKLISINTKGGNGPWVYSGDSSGLNPVEELDASTSDIKMDYGLGILSSSVMGINGAYGSYNGRVVGDVCDDSADWVNFNTLGHSSSTMDFFYELSIPLDELGVTSSQIASNGIGVLLVATFGKSGMDCLPYDVSMNDNADLDDSAGSQENNSFEKSDEDYITTSFARIGKSGGTIVPDELELNFGAEKSSPQTAGTALTLKGIAEGGTAPYTYKYYVNNSLVATKSGSGETSTTWTPSVAGEYLIKCVVTDSDGNSVTSSKYYDVEGTSTALSATLKVNGSSSTVNLTVGDSVTVKPTASGGSGSYTYKYVIKNVSTGATATLKDYSSSTSYTGTMNSVGTKQFIVYVKDSNGTVVTTNAVTVVTSEEDEELTASLKVNGSSSTVNLTVGDSVTVVPTASGGSGSYTYKYVIKNVSTGATATLKNYSTATSYTGTMTSAGTKQFIVYVQDSEGTVVQTNAVTVVTSEEDEELTASLKVNGSSSTVNLTVGDSVTVVPTASGGSGSYTYKYVIKNVATGATATLKNYSTATSYTGTMTSVGTKQFIVYVKDSEGTVVQTNAVTVVTKEESDALSATLKVNNSTSDLDLVVGDTVALKATASGGSGSYTYKFVIKNSAGTEYTLQNYSSSAIYSGEMTSAGTKTFIVYVKDSNGTVVSSNSVKVVVS